MVQVVLAGLEGRNHLTRHQYGGIAGIVVHVLQSSLHRHGVHLRQDDEVVAGILEGLLNQAEVDG